MPSLQSRALSAATRRQPSPRFTIGRDVTGSWVVQDRDGRVGGIFISEQAAVHFAADECAHDATQIVVSRHATLLPFGPVDGSSNVH